MIAIIDYGMGNLNSVQKAFEKVGAQTIITSKLQDIESSQAIVLPGVGSFGDGMKNLHKLGLTDILNEEVLSKKKPFLGICLGMQLICKIGNEGCRQEGLSWIDAEVVHFDISRSQYPIKVPHVGWNSVSFPAPRRLFENIPEGSDFYFVHSFHLDSVNGECTVVGKTEHGYAFVSAIQKDNIYATQFHPEKSQAAGLEVLKNFVALRGAQ